MIRTIQKRFLSIVKITPSSTIQHHLTAVTSFNKDPIVWHLTDWFGTDEQSLSHAHHISNNTGAEVYIPKLFDGYDEHTLLHRTTEQNRDWCDELIELIVKEGTNRKQALVGFGLGGAVGLEVASQLVHVHKKNTYEGEVLDQKKIPLNAVVSFYGLPPRNIKNLNDVPVYIPLQTHFGEMDSLKSFSDHKSAKLQTQKWSHMIQKHGGYHALGYHSLEEQTYYYHKCGHGFMDGMDYAIERNRKHAYSGDYCKEEADKAWERLIKFLTFHLKSI